MARTVKVDLLLEVGKYLRGARDAERSTKSVADGLADAATQGDRTASAVDAAGEAMRATARDAARLDRQIDDTAAGMRDLAREIARTSDEAARADLVGKLGDQQGRLRQLQQIRKLMDVTLGGDDDGARQSGFRIGTRLAQGAADGLARAGGPIAGALTSVFGTLPPQAQVGLGAGVVAAAASVAPAVGAAVAGAVVGAAGAGGVIGGLAVAARHSAVKAEAQQTGRVFAEVMQRSFVTFVPATVGQLGRVNDQLRAWESQLSRIGAASSRYLGPLLDGVLGGIDRALPGIVSAVEQAGPAVAAIGGGFIMLGESVGDVFDRLSRYGPEGAHALGMVFLVLSEGIQLVGTAIEGLTMLYGIAARTGALLTGDLATIAQLDAPMQQADQSAAGYAARLQEVVAGFRSATSGATATAMAVDRVTQAFSDFTNLTAETDQSLLRANQALAAVKSSFEANGRAIAGNSTKALENRTAIAALGAAAVDAAAKKYQETGSVQQATAVYDGYIGQLRKTLSQSGLTKKQIDELIATYAQLPPAIATRVSAPGATTATGQANDFNFAVRNVPPSKRVPFWASTGEATAAVTALQAKINSLRGKHIRVTGTVYWTSRGDLKVPGGTILKDRWGGVHEGGYTKAAAGVVREARMFDARSPGHYLVAEPETGGEAFVPKRGNRARSLGILDRAASWYGATVRPAPRYVTGPTTAGSTTHRVVIHWPTGEVAGEIVVSGLTEGRGMTGLRRAVADQGGTMSGLGL